VRVVTANQSIELVCCVCLVHFVFPRSGDFFDVVSTEASGLNRCDLEAKSLFLHFRA